MIAVSSENQKWPDGTVVHYPTKWVRAHLVHIPPADPTLNLHTRPSMKSTVVAKIPADANDVVVFTSDWEPNGKTRWYRSMWGDHRGYLGGGFIEFDSN